jgi:hypothetical protein
LLPPVLELERAIWHRIFRIPTGDPGPQPREALVSVSHCAPVHVCRGGKYAERM